MKLILMLGLFVLSANAGQAQTADVNFRTLDGGSFNLAESKGKVVVLFFTAKRSPLADRTLPAFQKLADRHPGGVEFYWASVDNARVGKEHYASDADLRALARQHSLRVKVLRDPEMAAFRALGLDAIPTVVIIDRTGKIHSKHVGFSPERSEGWNRITESLLPLLK